MHFGAKCGIILAERVIAVDDKKYSAPMREYSIEKTTKVQREKIVNEALGLSLLDAPMPSKDTLALVQEYIDGHMEISEILQRTIAKYDRTATA